MQQPSLQVTSYIGLSVYLYHRDVVDINRMTRIRLGYGDRELVL